MAADCWCGCGCCCCRCRRRCRCRCRCSYRCRCRCGFRCRCRFCVLHTTITHRPTGLPPSTHQSRTSLPFRPTPHPISHPIIIMSGGGHGTQCLLVIFCHNEVASLKLRQVWGGLAKGFPPRTRLRSRVILFARRCVTPVDVVVVAIYCY